MSKRIVCFALSAIILLGCWGGGAFTLFNLYEPGFDMWRIVLCGIVFLVFGIILAVVPLLWLALVEFVEEGRKKFDSMSAEELKESRKKIDSMSAKEFWQLIVCRLKNFGMR